MTALELLDEAGRRGLTLKPDGDRLLVIPARLCPPDFASALKARKYTLLALLGTKGVVIMRSAVLDATIYFAKDEAARDALLDAGAPAGSIYVREELRLLIESGVHAPEDLRRIHHAKGLFAGRIIPNDETNDSE